MALPGSRFQAEQHSWLPGWAAHQTIPCRRIDLKPVATSLNHDLLAPIPHITDVLLFELTENVSCCCVVAVL